MSTYAWAAMSVMPMLLILATARLAFRAWIRLLFAVRGFDVDPFGRGREDRS